MTDTTSIHFLIVAAGSGNRFGGDIPKQYKELAGRSLIRRTLDAVCALEHIGRVKVVIQPEHRDMCENALMGLKGITLVHGGHTRQESVYNGLRAFSDELGANDYIFIHDAARPFLSARDVCRLSEVLLDYEAATLGMRVSDTVLYENNSSDAGRRIDRDGLWTIQTPQAFHYGVILDAHENASTDQKSTDDTQLVSAMGKAVKLVEGHRHNIKITYPEDFQLAEEMIKQERYETRVGMGYDVHAFDNNVEGVEHIRICGIDIPFDRQLKGHSDADVGLHALTDAIFGALGEADIGTHFPPSDSAFENMDSAVFLEKAVSRINERGGVLINADITIICEKPKIGVHRDAIVKRVGEIMGVSSSRVNLKATTTEKLGFEGRREGIAAQAVVSIQLPFSDV